MPQFLAPVKTHRAGVLAVGAVLVVTTSMVQLSAQDWLPEPQMRRQGPGFTVQTARGDIQVESFRGKVVLVDFMTTTCPACRAASRGIQKVYAELGAQGFLPLGVALDVGSPLDLVPYARAQGVTFELGIAPRAEVLSYLRHRSDRPFLVPTLVLLDRHGRMCSAEVGWRGEHALRASVLKLLSEPETYK